MAPISSIGPHRCSFVRLSRPACRDARERRPQDLVAGFVQQSMLLPWSKVAAALHHSQLGMPEVRQIECCGKEGAWDVRFDNCLMTDIFAVNYTDMALRKWQQQRQQQRQHPGSG